MNPAIICYDGSEGARSAIHEAARFLGPREVIVLHVREEPPATAHAELVPTLESAMIERAQSVVDEGVAFAVEAGLDASPLMVQAHGPVWAAILGVVERRDPCVVVVGSRGLSGVKSALLGSVSAKVIHESSRPVVVVP